MISTNRNEAVGSAGRTHRVAVVTSSRADYSHLYWPLRELQDHPLIDLRIIAMAAHLAPNFGLTVEQIECDGFQIAHRVECLLDSNSDLGMAKTLGLATLSLADALAAMRPDLLLVIADRYEMLAPVTVALTLRIPVAHIEGGEISEGAIDDAVRNAITKMAHLHFTSTSLARDRVIGMGEEPWRVTQAGAPSLDHVRRSRLLTLDELQAALGVSLAQAPIVVAYHAVTLLADTAAEAQAFYSSLEAFAESDTLRPILFCHPNADAGAYTLLDRTRAFCARHAAARLYVNLPAVTYWSLLAHAQMLVGNSSSGIMEAASFALPAVDVGLRQFGRERSANVISAAPEVAPILAAMTRGGSASFRASITGMVNPYGDGDAARRIASVITETLASTTREVLLRKRGSLPPETPGQPGSRFEAID